MGRRRHSTPLLLFGLPVGHLPALRRFPTNVACHCSIQEDETDCRRRALRRGPQEFDEECCGESLL